MTACTHKNYAAVYNYSAVIVCVCECVCVCVSTCSTSLPVITVDCACMRNNIISMHSMLCQKLKCARLIVKIPVIHKKRKQLTVV